MMSYAKLLSLLTILILFLCSLAAAQTNTSITEGSVRLEDLAALLGTFQALEVPLPEGVRSVYLAQARGDELRGLIGISYDLAQQPAPERLRVVVGFPRAWSPFCGEGLLTLLARMEDAVTEGCYETPPNYEGGGWRSVGAGGNVVLGEWTPLFAYLPNVTLNPDTAQESFGTSGQEAWLIILLYAGGEPLEGTDPPSLPDLGRLRQELRLP